MREPLRIAVVEDDPRYRESLAQLFTHSPAFTLAASFPSALPAIAVERPEWDLVLMDLQLPGLSGVEATRRLKQISPALPVVILTVFEDPPSILSAITAGADGYLLKRTPAAELLDQLVIIVDGGAPLTAGVARTVLGLLRAQSGARSAPDRFDLTAREQEVLQCLVRGYSYKQAGERLGISVDTVRTHIRGIYRKLQVHNVAEAVVRAISKNMV